MSLSARIVLRPSRHLAVCEFLVMAGGLIVAAGALAARWPAWTPIIVLVALVSGLLVLGSIGRRPEATVVVSDRSEVGLSMDAVGADDGASWRVAEGTMAWPAFSVIALSSVGRTRRTLPVLDHALSRDDRRALHRFLLWTLRGGSGRRPRDA